MSAVLFDCSLKSPCGSENCKSGTEETFDDRAVEDEVGRDEGKGGLCVLMATGEGTADRLPPCAATGEGTSGRLTWTPGAGGAIEEGPSSVCVGRVCWDPFDVGRRAETVLGTVPGGGESDDGLVLADTASSGSTSGLSGAPTSSLTSAAAAATTTTSVGIFSVGGGWCSCGSKIADPATAISNPPAMISLSSCDADTVILLASFLGLPLFAGPPVVVVAVRRALGPADSSFAFVASPPLLVLFRGALGAFLTFSSSGSTVPGGNHSAGFLFSMSLTHASQSHCTQ